MEVKVQSKGNVGLEKMNMWVFASCLCDLPIGNYRAILASKVFCFFAYMWRRGAAKVFNFALQYIKCFSSPVVLLFRGSKLGLKLHMNKNNNIEKIIDVAISVEVFILMMSCSRTEQVKLVKNRTIPYLF